MSGPRQSFGFWIQQCAVCGDHHCWWCNLPMTQFGCSEWRCGWWTKPIEAALRRGTMRVLKILRRKLRQ